MIPLFTRCKMIGGLVFGPAAWYPQRIENTFLQAADSREEGGANTATAGSPVPTDRGSLAEFLKRMGLAPTGYPALRDELGELGERPLDALVLSLLPTQPEYALPGALSQLGLDDIRAGLGLLQGVLKPRRVVIVVDRHDHVTRRLWRRAVREAFGPPRPRIRCLLNRYPQAHPSVLVRSLFGIRLAVNELPTRHHHLLVDPVACWAIGRYLRTGSAFAERPVQLFVQDAQQHAARLVMGRLGETIAEFCARYGVATEGMQVIRNGVLSGEEVQPPAAVIDSATDAIALREPPAYEMAAPCLACGWCVDVCPTGLTPVRLMELAQRLGEPEAGDNGGRLKTLAILGTREARESRHCIGCGLCSYVCPSRLPLAMDTLHLRGAVEGADEHTGKPGAMP